MGILDEFQWEVEVGSTQIGPDRDILLELIHRMDKVVAWVALSWWLEDISKRIERLEELGAPRSIIEGQRSLKRGWIVNQLRKRLRED